MNWSVQYVWKMLMIYILRTKKKPGFSDGLKAKTVDSTLNVQKMVRTIYFDLVPWFMCDVDFSALIFFRLTKLVEMLMPPVIMMFLWRSIMKKMLMETPVMFLWTSIVLIRNYCNSVGCLWRFHGKNQVWFVFHCTNKLQSQPIGLHKIFLDCFFF